MLRLAADENFNNDIVRGLIRRRPDVGLVRVQDVGLSGASDPDVLEWASSQGRVLVTHDVSTISKYAYERAAAGRPMSGVFEIGPGVSIARAIEDLLLIVDCSLEGECDRIMTAPGLRDYQRGALDAIACKYFKEKISRQMVVLPTALERRSWRLVCRTIPRSNRGWKSRRAIIARS